MKINIMLCLLLPITLFAQTTPIQPLRESVAEQQNQAQTKDAATVVDESAIDRDHVENADPIRPPTNVDGTLNDFFDVHAELSKDEVDESLARGLVPTPRHENPMALPQRQEPRKTRVQEALESRYPLNAYEINTLRNEVNSREKAMYENTEARTQGKVINASLQDVRSMPKISIAQGYVVNLAFVDSYGNPWPVQGKSVGSVDSFSIIELGLGDDSNQIQIQGKRNFGSSNLIVLLRGASAPLVFDLKGGTSNDSRVDIVVAGTAPGAEAPRPDAILPPETDTAYSKIMTDLRNGVVGDTLTQLYTDAPLKLFQDEEGPMYVVGEAEVIQPACQAIVYGNAGMRICKIDYVPSTLLYVKSGQVMRAKVETTR